MSHWSDGYIGIPARAHGRDRDGCDCWGLVRLVYRDTLGMLVPSFTERYGSAEELRDIEALFREEAGDGCWQMVAAPRPFDLAIFTRGFYVSHVGIVVNPGLMLHVQGDDQAKLEHYHGGRWHHRLKGFYRHVETASRAVR